MVLEEVAVEGGIFRLGRSTPGGNQLGAQLQKMGLQRCSVHLPVNLHAGLRAARLLTTVNRREGKHASLRWLSRIAALCWQTPLNCSL